LKIIRLCLVFLVLLLLTGCKEYGEKRIVTLFMADSEKVSLYYYDFSAEKPTYLKEEKDNNGLKNTLTEMLAENDYDLKLCKYAVVSEDIINNINELYFALTDTRFAPDIVVLKGDTNKTAEEYIELKKDRYPLYNYRYRDESTSCIVENAEDEEKNIIINNMLYKTLNRQQGFCIDILADNSNTGVYYFVKDEKNYSAELSGINTFHSVRDNILYININAVLKSYKGMPSDKNCKKQMEKMLAEDIRYNIKSLLSDKTITEKFDILWYKNVENFEKININVNII